MLENFRSVTVIAPHPDDETLGAGGTIARLCASGVEVSVLIVSGHLPPLYPPEMFENTRSEAQAAMKALGVDVLEFLEVPATFVASEPVAKLNGAINAFLAINQPQAVLIPFPDRHIDHRVIFDASLVCCRPTHDNAPKVVLAYETLSETHWNVPGVEPAFVPEFFYDISDYLEMKRTALSCYVSQVSDTPSRSTEACEALARFRGSQNGFTFAEAFKVVRIAM
jgi:LmbE family N-acetylglucosaminyl deacetylase